jgi:hypothetical protein
MDRCRDSRSSEDVTSAFFVGEYEPMRASKRGKAVVLEGQGRSSGTPNGRGLSSKFEVICQRVGKESGVEDSDSKEGDEECNDEED